MIQFAKSVPPAPVSSRSFQYVSYALGAWTALLAVAQMVSFEEFVEALRQYQLGSESWTLAYAIGLVGLEVFAVPFLFRVALSPAARFVSALFALFVPLSWATLMIHVFWGNLTVDNAGYFGGFFQIHVGWLALIVSLTWAVVAVMSFGKIGGARALRGAK